MALLSSRLRQQRQAMVFPHVRGDVLDIGCQRGMRLGGRIGRYVGIDLSPSHLAEARRCHPDCEFRLINIDDEPRGYESEFDTVVMSDAIEHTFNLKHVGRNLARALRPDGQVLLTTPLGNDVVHRLGAALGRFARSAAGDHIVIFNKKRLETFAKECGLILAGYRRFQMGCNQMALLWRPADMPAGLWRSRGRRA